MKIYILTKKNVDKTYSDSSYKIILFDYRVSFLSRKCHLCTT